LKKERDLAFEGKCDEVPKEFFTRKVWAKMNEMKEDFETQIQKMKAESE
jgi:hypothetical protein